MKEEHTQKGEIKQKHGLQCKFCEECFESKRELMEHRKKEHTERVSVCWKFTSGQCEYGIEKCWFNHGTERSETKCNFCEQTFPNMSEFLTHRKKYHLQFVPPCRNLPNGACNYTNENCWFNHKDNEMTNENENNENEIEENREVIQKIFKMMENFTKEIIQIKERNNLQ